MLTAIVNSPIRRWNDWVLFVDAIVGASRREQLVECRIRDKVRIVGLQLAGEPWGEPSLDRSLRMHQRIRSGVIIVENVGSWETIASAGAFLASFCRGETLGCLRAVMKTAIKAITHWVRAPTSLFPPPFSILLEPGMQ